LLTYVFALFFNLIRICRKYDVDIIHAHHAIPTGTFSVIVSKILGKPSFITTHGMDITTHGIAEGPLKNVSNFEDHFIFKHLLSYSLRNCDRVLPVSNDLKKRIMALGVKEDKITILRNAVDINRFTPERKNEIRQNYNIDEEDIVILFVGHLEVFKGLFELIYAFNNVKKENKKVKLILIGDGSQKIRSKQEIEKLGLEESVFYAGKIPPSDIHEYYQNSDIFVLPSQTDAGGPPVVFIEAMACGLPIIGTNVGGIPEGIENGVNGFIVPTKNENELTKKLKLLVNDKDCRVNFGRKSIEKIQNEFNIDKKINRLLEIYKQYLSLNK
ncbi:MAG TPA: glycosyltransferase family 4 protein, partial [Methanothermobacter sp.]|nr:glycosyltransferase family 4 protein [Methanothermobacter sp.]